MADKKERSFIGLRDLTDASKLADKRRQTDTLRSGMKRDWGLNRAYYEGNQWSFWNPQQIRVEDMPINALPSWRVRIVSNQIKPGLANYVAQLTKTRPTIYAEPDSGTDTDVKAAQMATSLYEYLWDEMQLNSAVQDALTESGLSGGFWLISWDSLAGKEMTITVGPDGQPIVDDALAEVYLEQLAQVMQEQGQDPQKALAVARQSIYLGDISVQTLTAENVWLDPVPNKFEECKWAICRHLLDPDEIEARWGRKVQPNATKASEITLPWGEDKKPDETLREVFIMYIRPNPSLPKGRYVAWIEGPDEILQDMDWPYPFRDLPLVKFPGKYRPNSPYDDPVVTEARPMQKDLNKSLSQIIEHRNLTLKPQIFAPQGSLLQKITGEPGAVFEFGGPQIPQWREIPALPAYVFDHLAGIQARIDAVFNKQPSQRDQLPARVDSGQLVQVMQESIADQLSNVILGLEDALARAGHLMAAYAKAYYVEPRLLKIRGSGGSVQVKKFQGADIEGGFSFRPRYGTALPRSREGKRMAIMDLVDRQMIDPMTAMKHLDLGDLKGVQSKMARDEDHALREQDKMLRGEPINVPAIQAAQSAIEQFQQQAEEIASAIDAGIPLDLNQDGVPDDPNDVFGQLQQQWMQLQMQLQDAPWQPLPYENKQMHAEVHGDFLKTQEFEKYPPELQAIAIKHFELTMQALAADARNNPDPKFLPKLNVTAKTTMSAPTLSKILEAQGIESPPEEVAMEPMETAVYDSVDKPDASSAANNPLTQEEHDMSMQQQQDAHDLAQAQTAQALGIAEETHASSQDKTQQQMVGNEQNMQLDAMKRMQEMQHAQELHQEKLKQMRKPKPKPASK